MSVEKSMLLTTSMWESEKPEIQYETFNLMPIAKECPFREGFFDPEVGVLVLMSKECREQFTPIPRINEFGSEIFKRNRKLVHQQRIQIPVEHIIEDPKEIRNFLNLFAYNTDTFDFEKYLDGPVMPSKRRENISAATL
jgi:hypothetical protein